MTNLGFETLGGAAGMAEGWHVRGRFSAVEIAAFGPVPTIGIAQPHELDGMTWTPSGVTVSGDVDDDPDGATTADRLTETATTSTHADLPGFSDLVEDTSYGLSCWLKNETRGYAALAWGLGTGNETSAIFDLVNCRVVSVSRSGSISEASATIFELGSTGWMLATLYVTTDATILSIRSAIMLSNGTALSYAGNIANTILAWGVALYDLPREPFEAFERAWGNDDFLSTLTIPTSAYPSTFLTSFASPEGFEAFESAWTNFPFYTTIVLSASATFDTTPEALEDFEEDWNNSPFYTTISGAVAATFDTSPENFEDFEDNWLTSSWVTTIPAPVLATFDGDIPEAFEDFEEVRLDEVYTIDIAGGNLVNPSHGLAVDDTIYVVAPAGGVLPAGLNPTVRYFVVVIGAMFDTFQISTTEGGTPIGFTDIGVGVQRYRSDPARFWNEGGYNSTL